MPDESGGLRRLAIRGAGATVFSQVMMLAVQLVATLVLARLLTPSDFGLVAMVTTFSLLLASVGQVGFQEAVVQREEIDHALASNLFWINLLIGFVLTVGFAGAGSLLAKLYHDPRVTRVSVGMSLMILLTSVSVLHLALLKRGMRFTAVSVINVLARAVSVLVSIAMGWTGWGYWALVAGAVVQALIISLGAFLLCPWMPSLPRRIPGTGSLVWFAARVNGRWNLDYFTRNMDNLLVGWRFGPAPLGYYKRAYDLFALPANQFLSVFPVAVSTLSRLHRDPPQYKKYFLGGLSVLALVGVAAGAELTLVGRDIVRILLGPGWDMAGQIFTYFGPGIGVMLVYGTHGMMHLSLGTPGRWFRWGIVEFVVTGLLFLAGLHWGPVGVAAAWTASFWILTIPAFWYAGQPIGFGASAIVATVWRFLVASGLAGFASVGIMHFFPSLAVERGWVGALVRVVVTSLLFLILYVLAVILLHGNAAPLRQFARLFGEMLPWRKHSGGQAVQEQLPEASLEPALSSNDGPNSN